MSSTPAGCLEVPLLLTFTVERERISELMKDIDNSLYEYDYSETIRKRLRRSCNKLGR